MKIVLLFFSVLFFSKISCAQQKVKWGFGIAPILSSQFLDAYEEYLYPSHEFTAMWPMTTDGFITSSRQLEKPFMFGGLLEFNLRKSITDKLEIGTGLGLLCQRFTVYEIYNTGNNYILPNGLIDFENYQSKEVHLVSHARVPLDFAIRLHDYKSFSLLFEFGISCNLLVYSKMLDYSTYKAAGNTPDYNKLVMGSRLNLIFRTVTSNGKFVNIHIPEFGMSLTPDKNDYSIKWYNYYFGGRVSFMFGKGSDPLKNVAD